MSKVVKGVFKWSDGEITAAAIRDDMFEHAGVELLCPVTQVSEFYEIIEIANCFANYPEDVVHLTAKEARKILKNCWTFYQLADNVIKVSMPVVEMKEHFGRDVYGLWLMYFIITDGTYWDAHPS